MSKIRAVIKTDEGKEEIFYHLSLYLQYYGATIGEEKLKSALALEKERYPELDLELVFKNILNKAFYNRL